MVAYRIMAWYRIYMETTLKPVTKDQFFAAVRSLDLNPSIRRDRWSREIGYTSDWKTRSGRIMGQTFGSESCTTKPTYMLEVTA